MQLGNYLYRLKRGLHILYNWFYLLNHLSQKTMNQQHYQNQNYCHSPIFPFVFRNSVSRAIYKTNISKHVFLDLKNPSVFVRLLFWDEWITSTWNFNHSKQKSDHTNTTPKKVKIWWFPKIGVPSNQSFSHHFLQETNHFGGSTISGKAHIQPFIITHLWVPPSRAEEAHFLLAKNWGFETT